MNRLISAVIPAVLLAPTLLIPPAASSLDSDLLCYMRTQAGQLLDLTPLCGESGGLAAITHPTSTSPTGLESSSGMDAATWEKEEHLVYNGQEWKSYINPKAVEVYNENRKFWVRDEPVTPLVNGLDSHMVFTVVICANSESTIGKTKELNYKADGSLIDSATEMLDLKKPTSTSERGRREWAIISYVCALKKVRLSVPWMQANAESRPIAIRWVGFVVVGQRLSEPVVNDPCAYLSRADQAPDTSMNIPPAKMAVATPPKTMSIPFTASMSPHLIALDPIARLSLNAHLA